MIDDEFHPTMTSELLLTIWEVFSAPHGWIAKMCIRDSNSFNPISIRPMKAVLKKQWILTSIVLALINFRIPSICRPLTVYPRWLLQNITTQNWFSALTMKPTTHRIFSSAVKSWTPLNIRWIHLGWKSILVKWWIHFKTLTLDDNLFLTVALVELPYLPTKMKRDHYGR